jgi:hypothetical protein
MICLSLSGLCSCEKDREYNEAEVLAATADLIEKSLPLNEMFYGKGIAYTDEGVGIYKIADTESLNSFGVSTVEEMKSLAREVYTESFCKGLYSSEVFSSVKIDDTVKSYTRYYQELDSDGNPTHIMVNSKYEYFLKGSYEYNENMSVIDVSGEVITVRTLVSVTSESGKVKNINLDLKLIEEADGWRLASPTYAVYNEYTDIYEDLKK